MAKSPVEHSPVTKADLARFESELSKYFGSHTYSVLDAQFDYEELTSEKINELDKTRKQLLRRIYTELAELQKQKTALQGNSLTSQAWDWARWISGASAWDDELAEIEDRIKTQNDLLTDLVGGAVFGRTTSNMLKSLDVLLDLDNYSDDGEEVQELISPSRDKKPALEIQIPQLTGVTKAAEKSPVIKEQKITPQASHTSKPHVESPVSPVKVKETSVDEETPRTTQNMLAALLQEAAPDINASKKPLPTVLTPVITPLVTESNTGSPLQEQLTVIHTADGDETSRTLTNKPEVQLDTDKASIVVTPEVELDTDKASTVQLDSQLQSPKDKMVVADGTKPTQMEITSPKEDVREVAEQVTRDIVEQVVASLSTTTDTPVSSPLRDPASPLRDPSSPLKIQTADDGPKATTDEQPLVKALNHELMRLQNKAINSKGFSLNMFWHASYQAKADRLERVINSLTGKSQLTDENIKALIKDQTSDLSQALNAHTGLMFGACLPGFTLTTQTGGISSSQARAYLNMQKIVELQEATPVATNSFGK